MEERNGWILTFISEGICGAAGAAAGAGEDVAAAEVATVRAAELAAEAGGPACAALAGAAKDSGAVDPKLGATVVPDAIGAEGAGALLFPSENPTEPKVVILSKSALLTEGTKDL